MTNKERLADIKRIRDDVALGVHDFDHTDVEGLLAELDRRQARIANYERLAEAVQVEHGGHLYNCVVCEALAACEPEETDG